MSNPQAAPDPGVPYAFETMLHDSAGGEIARLESQNLLLEKHRPLDHLPPTPDQGRVLDVGSGTGFWSLRLAARVPLGQVVCLDRSPELLGHARARLEAAGVSQAVYLQQDLRQLALPTATFDLVFTCVTLTHVAELDAALTDLVAALKPGGWIACFEPLQGSDRMFNLHPPCPKLDRLMDRMAEVARARGSDFSVALKIAHHLEQMGLEAVAVRSFGEATHGAEARSGIQEVFLPIVRTYLLSQLAPAALDALLAEAQAEAAAHPSLWVDLKRTIVLGRKPAAPQGPRSS